MFLVSFVNMDFANLFMLATKPCSATYLPRTTPACLMPFPAFLIPLIPKVIAVSERLIALPIK